VKFKFSDWRGDAASPPEPDLDTHAQNLETILEFYRREEQKITRSQRILERISRFMGQPVYLGLVLLFVAIWMFANSVLRDAGIPEFDPAPYFWLQGMLGFGALLTATVVLIRQNRIAKLEEQRAHLDLKVTLLTEQKTAKIIDILEELRRDLPNVRNRVDAEAVAMTEPINADQVLAALDEPLNRGDVPKVQTVDIEL
jgi:uncharacterized membrane protein